MPARCAGGIGNLPLVVDLAAYGPLGQRCLLKGSAAGGRLWPPLIAPQARRALPPLLPPAVQGQQPPPSGAVAALDERGLTNNPLDYDPITNEHTAAMTLARKLGMEAYEAGRCAWGGEGRGRAGQGEAGLGGAERASLAGV
jgi:hypothetical protein